MADKNPAGKSSMAARLCGAFIVVLVFALLGFGIAYVVVGPLFTAILILAALMLIQYPLMRIVIRRKYAAEEVNLKATRKREAAENGTAAANNGEKTLS